MKLVDIALCFALCIIAGSRRTCALPTIFTTEKPTQPDEGISAEYQTTTSTTTTTSRTSMTPTTTTSMTITIDYEVESRSDSHQIQFQQPTTLSVSEQSERDLDLERHGSETTDVMTSSADRGTPSTILPPADCRGNETEKSERVILAVKSNILKKLGMSKVPDVSNVNLSVQERREVLRLYRKSLEEVNVRNEANLFIPDDEFYASQFHSFTDAGESPLFQTSWPRQDNDSSVVRRIYFIADIREPADARHETIVKSAALKLFKHRVVPENLLPTNNIENTVRVDIYQTVYLPEGQAEGGNHSGRWLRKFLDSKLISLDAGIGWEEFNIAPAVQDWIRRPESNYGLEVVTDSRYTSGDVIEWVTREMGDLDEHRQAGRLPVLNVLTQARSILSRRFQRSVGEDPRPGDCTPGVEEGLCCRDKLIINFRDLNWNDWIIQPETYTLYHCQGGCPAGHRVAHHFSQLKTLVMNADPQRPVTVQCTATKLSPLRIAHFNERGEAVISVLNDMFADQCMCA